MARDGLLGIAHRAMDNSHAPYSRFRVGAALRFADGTVVTGSNAENASYGLSLCAEAVAVHGSAIAPSPPCGRCRQMLTEMARLGGTDPVVWSAGEGGDVIEARLSALLPHAFGPECLDKV